MIKFGIMPEQRQICLIPIPFSDLTSAKRRPVLIISNDKYNNNSEDILVMAITSNLKNRINTKYFEQSDLETGDLKTPSLIRIDKIYSLHQKLLLNSFGKISLIKYNAILVELFM